MDECTVTSHTVHQNAPYCKWHVLDTPTSESSVPRCVKCSLLTDRVPCSRYLWSSYLSSVLYRRMAMSALRCWAETLSHRRSRYANYSATIFEIVLQSTIDRFIIYATRIRTIWEWFLWLSHSMTLSHCEKIAAQSKTMRQFCFVCDGNRTATIRNLVATETTFDWIKSGSSCNEKATPHAIKTRKADLCEG